MTDRPVFVGACPRSGTTLLRTMLDTHPDLGLPLETRFVLGAWRRRLTFGDLADAANRRRLARWIFRRPAARPQRLGVDAREGIERLVAAPPTIGSLLGTCFRMYAERHGKARWGDKRPLYVQHLDAIFAMFPDAQVVTLVRDPRAVAASLRRLGWFDLPAAVALWKAAAHATDRWAGRRPGQVVQLRYEDLVAAPEQTLRGLSGHLGLDQAYVETMLRFHENRALPDGRHHHRVAEPVSGAALRSWERDLGREEVALVESATSRLMARFDYHRVAAGVSVPPALRLAYERRRVERTVKRAKWVAGEAHRRRAYRHPVAYLP